MTLLDLASAVLLASATAASGWADTVPEPWTPLVVKEQAVQCWNREYTWAEGLLPARITSGDQALLRGPMQLAAMVHPDPEDLAGSWSGIPQEWTPSSFRVVQAAPDVVQVVTTSESPSLRAECQFTIEFDGMVLCDLTIHPKTAAVELRDLRITLPFAPEHARLYSYLMSSPPWEHPFDKEPFNGGALPPYLALPFESAVWIGDEQRGLQWFAESEEGLSPHGHFFTVDKARTATLSLCGTRTLTSEKPFHFQFGLMASPIKPMRAPYQVRWQFGWHSPAIWKNASGGTEGSPLEAFHKNGARFYHLLDPATPCETNLFFTHEDLPRLREESAKLGMYPMASGAVWINQTNPNFQPEWGLFPRVSSPIEDPSAKGSVTTLSACCMGSRYADYLLAKTRRAFDEMLVDGVYLDGVYAPVPCMNAQHGCGYVDGDGNRHYTTPILRVRQFAKELYRQSRSTGRPACIAAHISGMVALPVLAFADVYLDGEQLGVLPEGEVWDLAGFRAEMMGHPFGVPGVYLHYARTPEDRQRTNTLAALHDMNPFAFDESAAQLLTALEEFGTADAAWTGYWNVANPLTSDAEVQISSYVKKNRGALSVIGNLGRTAVICPVKIDFTALGLEPTAKILDLTKQQSLPVSNGCVNLTIEPGRYALLRLRPE